MESKDTRFSLAYDTRCKRVLSHKRLIANLMKTFIPEYKNLGYEDIENCIEGVKKDSNYVESLNTEDIMVDDKKVIYDLLFNAHLPGNNNEEVGIKINIEPQGEFKTSDNDSDVSRAVYYASRLYSNQQIKEYTKLKEVYSIWICGSFKNTFITSLEYNQNHLLGNFSFKEKHFQKIHIIIIGLGNDSIDDNDSYKRMISILKLLLNRNVIINDTIKEKLENSYGILYSKEDIDNMSGWGEFLIKAYKKEGFEEGFEEGIKEGIQEGIQEGKLTNAVSNIKNVMSSLNVSLERAIEILKIDDSIKDDVIKEFNL